MAGERDRWVLGVIAAAVSCALGATWYYATHTSLVGYQDVQSHLAIARRVLDNRTPGLVQLGTTWLPVPQLLLLPFVQNDVLWHTGLAGSIVGAGCLVVTCVTVFLSLRMVTGRNLPAAVGVSVLLTNPSFLYVHTVALTEPVVIAAMTASTYFLLRWTRDDRTTTLLVAGLCTALAVGCRYDGWVFSLASVLIVGAIVAVRTGNPLRTEGYMLSYGILPAYALLLYLLYNWTYFHDPLAFQHGEASAQVQQYTFEAKGLLLTKRDLWLSMRTYNWAIMDTAGWIVVAIGVAGLMTFVVRERRRAENWPVVALLAGWPFNVLALYTAQSIILVPQELPRGIYNVRYGLLMLPALAIGTAYLYYSVAARLRNRFMLPLCGFLLYVQMVFWIPGFPDHSLAVVDEGMYRQSNNSRVHNDIAGYLGANYDGGGILLDDTTATIFTLTPLDVREYVSTFNGIYWREALIDPATKVRWIVAVNPEDANALGSGDRVTLRALNNPYLLQDYTRVYLSGDFAVFRRKEEGPP